MFIKIRGKFKHNISNSDGFRGQGHYIIIYIIKWYFQHFSTGRTYQTCGVFKNLSLNIKTSDAYHRYYWLGVMPVMYVSMLCKVSEA